MVKTTIGHRIALMATLTSLAILAPPAHADETARVLEAHAVLNVGVRSPLNFVHVDEKGFCLDIGIGETLVAFILDNTFHAELGYQYAGPFFAGVVADTWSVRLGLDPKTGVMLGGAGIGAPLLPVASVVTDSVIGGYAQATTTQEPEALFNAGTAIAGRVAAVLPASTRIPYGVGVQIALSPTVGSYVFAGIQGEL